MLAITPDSLMSLDSYAKVRKEFSAKVIVHKKSRSVQLGRHLTLQFEDELTIRYQLQEMLCTKQIFAEEEISDELESYNSLIPDGSNWKATLLIEYEDLELRRQMLVKLTGIEDRVWIRVAGFNKVFAIANEDIELPADQTSSTHFLCFELAGVMIAALKAGAQVAMGADHPAYEVSIAEIDPARRQALVADLT